MEGRTLNGVKVLGLFVFMLLLISLGFSDFDDHNDEEGAAGRVSDDHSIQVTHIHGIDFHDNDIIVATHHGLIRFDGGQWDQLDSPAHDYMGFSMTEGGFYASGHPDPSTSLKNPMGIIWTDDLGKHIKPVAFYGELDFHWLTVGYKTLNMYAYTSDSTTTTPAGFYHSSDNGKSWQPSALQGVNGKLLTFIAHPIIPGAVFMSTSTGIFLSIDNADNFVLMMKNLEPGALTVTDDGRYLLSGTTKLTRLEISTRELKDIKVPDLNTHEILTDITVSTENYDIIVLNTNLLNMFITEKGGKHWEKIMTLGRTEYIEHSTH